MNEMTLNLLGVAGGLLLLALIYYVLVSAWRHVSQIKINERYANREIPVNEAPEDAEEYTGPPATGMGFSEALGVMLEGGAVRRKRWQPHVCIKIQKPTTRSKMTEPYIYMTVKEFNRDQGPPTRAMAPWQPSQLAILGTDWETT